MTKYKKTCVLNMTIIECLEFINVNDVEIYRIFENGHCCRLTNVKTDKEIAFFEFIAENYFIQYNNYEPNDKKCKKCGAYMKIFISKYGEFLECSNYSKSNIKKLYI